MKASRAYEGRTGRLSTLSWQYIVQMYSKIHPEWAVGRYSPSTISSKPGNILILSNICEIRLDAAHMYTLIEIKSIIYRQIFCLASISAAIKLRNTKRLIECNILYFGMDHYSLERGGWAIPRKKKKHSCTMKAKGKKSCKVSHKKEIRQKVLYVAQPEVGKIRT